MFRIGFYKMHYSFNTFCESGHVRINLVNVTRVMSNLVETWKKISIVCVHTCSKLGVWICEREMASVPHGSTRWSMLSKKKVKLIKINGNLVSLKNATQTRDLFKSKYRPGVCRYAYLGLTSQCSFHFFIPPFFYPLKSNKIKERE